MGCMDILNQKKELTRCFPIPKLSDSTCDYPTNPAVSVLMVIALTYMLC